jgi:hypothetical protein
MIKVNLKLDGNYGSKYETIEVTKEEIIDLATRKAQNKYEDGYYKIIEFQELESFEFDDLDKEIIKRYLE